MWQVSSCKVRVAVFCLEFRSEGTLICPKCPANNFKTTVGIKTWYIDRWQ